VSFEAGSLWSSVVDSVLYGNLIGDLHSGCSEVSVSSVDSIENSTEVSGYSAG